MDDSMVDPFDMGFREVQRRLEAYGDRRLTPSLTATARMRTNVMNAANRRAAVVAAGPSVTMPSSFPTMSVGARRGPARPVWLRPAAAFFAGCLTLSLLGGTAFAASPGGPLYTARLWTEMAILPAEVDARATAEVSRLVARISEAQAAMTAGDGPATKAALAAYTSIVAEAARGAGGDATATAAIEASLTRDIALLTGLLDKAPGPARAALEQVLASTAAVLRDLGATGRRPNAGGSIDGDVTKANGSGKQGVDDWLPGTPGASGGSNPGGLGGGKDGAGVPAQPDNTAKPDKTAKPEKRPGPADPPGGGQGHDPVGARPSPTHGGNGGGRAQHPVDR